MVQRRPDLDEQMERFEQRLPDAVARVLRRLRHPGAIWLRVPAAIALMLGGILSFLPILGVWMLPLGLVLIAQDIPFLRPPMARLLAWIDRKWPAQKPKVAKGE